MFSIRWYMQNYKIYVFNQMIHTKLYNICFQSDDGQIWDEMLAPLGNQWYAEKANSGVDDQNKPSSEREGICK